VRGADGGRGEAEIPPARTHARTYPPTHACMRPRHAARADTDRQTDTDTDTDTYILFLCLALSERKTHTHAHTYTHTHIMHVHTHTHTHTNRVSERTRSVLIRAWRIREASMSSSCRSCSHCSTDKLLLLCGSYEHLLLSPLSLSRARALSPSLSPSFRMHACMHKFLHEHTYSCSA